MHGRLLTIAAMLVCAGSAAAAEFEAALRLQNATGEQKTNWPVFLTVCKVFGGNLKLDQLNAAGFHVFDGSGREVPHMLRPIPPDFSLGNDEIVFAIPKIAAGEALGFRVTNTAAFGKTAEIDLIGNPNNLLPNGGFEAGEGPVAAGYVLASDKGVKISYDAKVKRSGGRSLLLTFPVGTAGTLRTAEPVSFRKEGLYHFSMWGRCENVAYNGWGFWGAGFSARFEPTAFRGRESLTLRGDRDWHCCRFDSGGSDAWAVPLESACGQSEKVRKGPDEVPADIWAKAEGKAYFVLGGFQQGQPFLKGEKTGKVWIDDVLLFEQPVVTVDRAAPLARAARGGAVVFARPVNLPRWGAFAHEAAEKLEAFAMPGERRQIRFGVYAAEPLEGLECSCSELTGPGGRLDKAVELETLGYYVEQLKLPAKLERGQTAEFLLSVSIPRGTRSGIYRGDVTIRSGRSVVRALPIILDVLPFEAPSMEGYWVGGIYNVGMGMARDEAFYRCYAKTGFNYLMLFDYLFSYKGDGEIDFAAAQKQVDEMVELAGATGGIGLYREPNMSEDQPRKWYQLASSTEWSGKYAHGTDGKFKAGYQKLARSAHQYALEHRWPTLIYMVSDEPSDRRDVDASMGWLNEAVPQAITCADAQFKDMLNTWKWYNLPVLDDPVDWTGPLVYDYVKAHAKRFGFCGTGWSLDVGRYQPGLMLASSGACYWHFWHAKGPFEPRGGKVVRTHAVAAMAEGFNDLRYYVALRQAIEKARKSGKPTVADEAEKYLAGIFAFATADHDRHLMPYNGVPWMWGAGRFYDNWRARMKDYILRLGR